MVSTVTTPVPALILTAPPAVSAAPEVSILFRMTLTADKSTPPPEWLAIVVEAVCVILVIAVTFNASTVVPVSNIEPNSNAFVSAISAVVAEVIASLLKLFVA